MADGRSDEHPLAARLVRGEDVSDEDIDALLPERVRLLSSLHWTPVRVAQAAARFLAAGHAPAHILDVGSGAGKFCAVGALSTGARFTGVERRPTLVQVAKDLAATLGANGVDFTVGRMEEIEWSRFTGVYFYNPFGEHFLCGDEHIDRSHPTGWAVYVHYVRAALSRLYLMPAGTRVVTYHGIGAPLPPGYDLVGGEKFAAGPLRFYIRKDPLLLEGQRRPKDFFAAITDSGEIDQEESRTDPIEP
ncbi:MAG: methyltransferase domain-containing protein [Deltaproteobacteria bacterium]|nr:methyltransferase domain-containing protein [Deltaproteobacteria bacterium]